MFKTMKVAILLMVIILLPLGQLQAAPKSKQKFVTADETLAILHKMGLAQGNETTYIKSSPSSDKEWMTHLFMVKQNGASMPMLTYVNSHDVVVGILIRDGKLVTPKMSVDEMQPRLDMSKTNLSKEQRMAYNSNGKEILYMFTDPDCPYCQSIEKALPAYSGKYKVIIKHFPIDQIHPGAKDKAIDKQCHWINQACDAQTKQISQQIVDQDIREATDIGINATPVFIGENGAIMHQIPDLKTNDRAKK